MEDSPIPDSMVSTTLPSTPATPTTPATPVLTPVAENVPWPRLLAKRMLLQMRQIESIFTTRAVPLAHSPTLEQVTHIGTQNYPGNIFVPSPIAVAPSDVISTQRTVDTLNSTMSMPCDNHDHWERQRWCFDNQCHYISMEAGNAIWTLLNILSEPSQSMLGGAAVSRTSQDPNAFHCFGRLPAELRFKIWELAMGPIPICRHYYEVAQRLQDFNDRRPYAYNCEGLAAAPLMENHALMLVCKESRRLTLRRNKKVREAVFGPLAAHCSHFSYYYTPHDFVVNSFDNAEYGEYGGHNNGTYNNGSGNHNGFNADVDDNAEGFQNVEEDAEEDEEDGGEVDDEEDWWDNEENYDEENEEESEEKNSVDLEAVDDHNRNADYFENMTRLNLVGNRLRRRLAELHSGFPELYTRVLGPFGMTLVSDLFKVSGKTQQLQ